MDDIARAGLPVPPKSSCFYLSGDETGRSPTVTPRAAASDRALGGTSGTAGAGDRGVVAHWDPRRTWRGEPRPGSITAFIRQERLLPAEELEVLIRMGPSAIVTNQHRFRTGDAIPSSEREFLDVGCWSIPSPCVPQ